MLAFRFILCSISCNLLCAYSFSFFCFLRRLCKRHHFVLHFFCFFSSISNTHVCLVNVLFVLLRHLVHLLLELLFRLSFVGNVCFFSVRHFNTRIVLLRFVILRNPKTCSLTHSTCE